MKSAIHSFEVAGLGKAPYTYLGCIKCPSSCQYCGTGILYQFHLKSSDGNKFFVGSDCIEKSGDLGLIAYAVTERKKISREKRMARKQAQYEARQAEYQKTIQDRLASFLDTHKNIAHIFEWAKNTQGIPQDIYNKLIQWGSCSDRQIEFLTNLYNSSLVVKADCPCGKVTIEGVIVGTKTSLSQFGYITKMIVESNDGYRVYGTIPTSLGVPQKGTKVRFNATVEQSSTDQHFGFYSRPTKAIVLD